MGSGESERGGVKWDQGNQRGEEWEWDQGNQRGEEWEGVGMESELA